MFVDDPTLDVKTLLTLAYNQKDFIRSNYVAIGEIGLDYHDPLTTPEMQQRQKDYLVGMLQFAVELHLPVIIHSRDAYTETLSILTAFQGRLTGVWHCFNLSPEQALPVVALGLKLGIGGVLTFKNAVSLQQTVKELDLRHFLLETDCPFLAPVPFRGKDNHPAYVRYVLEKISQIKQSNIKEVEAILTASTYHVFTKMKD
jgi:TatD DNase family protein